MSPFWGEFIGTGMVIILGQGVVSNVVLQKSKGYNSGWIVISFGWAMGVFVGVYCSAAASKAHLNPAVTLAFAVLGKISWGLVPIYMAVFPRAFCPDGRCGGQARRLLHDPGYPQLWRQPGH
jgi:glycerol uptake facilitator protein